MYIFPRLNQAPERWGRDAKMAKSEKINQKSK
jgi:hypothetical protein